MYNTWADSLSRQEHLPDWNLSQLATHLIFAQWGVPVIDLFATAKSAVVPRFVVLSTQDHRGAVCRCLLASVEILPYLDISASSSPPSCASTSKRSGGPVHSNCPLLVFWWPDLVARAVGPPMKVKDLQKNLIDLSTGRPPSEV